MKQQLLVLLEELDIELKRHQLWSDSRPLPEQLASSQPFAVDTLSFQQWLQFIFIPRMQLILIEDGKLPDSCCICPMAEESFRQQGIVAPGVIQCLARVDALFESA